MSKKILMVAAVLMIAGTVFGAYDANKFTTQVPPMTIPDPCDASKTIPNPAYADFDKANKGTDRTVDWESDGNNLQRKGESWNWPATYDYVPITEVKVQMDVGFWIRVTDCSTNKIIKLKQRQIRMYAGFVGCKAYTNVATQWKADFKKKEGIDLGGYNKEAAVDPSTFDAAPGGKDINIKLKLWDVDLKNLPAGTNCLDIGTVVVSVRPNVKPNLFMSGCGGSYPVYAPPPVLPKTNPGPEDGMIWW
jgi:hypothetical protein